MSKEALRANRWKRFDDWDDRPLSFDQFAREDAEQGFAAWKGSADPKPEVKILAGKVVGLDGTPSEKFDIIDETLSRTNLGSLKEGSVVNLERSISASSEIGGHLMSGHIHFTGKVKSCLDKDSTKDLAIYFPNNFKKYIFEKGYIGINGCSLTIGKVSKSYFLIHLIPETLAITNLSALISESLVNVEIDQNTIAIVETVEKTLAAQKS